MTYIVSITKPSQVSIINAMLENTADERGEYYNVEHLRSLSIYGHITDDTVKKLYVIDNRVFFDKFKIIDFWENYRKCRMVFETEKDAVMFFLMSNKWS